MKMLLDESLPLTRDVPHGARRKLAIYGIAEKGQRCSACDAPARLVAWLSLPEDAGNAFAPHHRVCARCVRRMAKAIAKVRP